MREVIRLVQDIRNCLAGNPGSPPAEALAGPYVRWRHEAASRLEACALMFAKGSDYQVLQFAETEPPLMDLVAELSFAEEPKWLDYCRQNQLPTPPPLDLRTVRALESVYSKGITPNSELYRDYRAAVSSRDETRALQIIRSIVRLNPSDSNARLEFGRWQNKRMLASLKELQAAITSGEWESVASLADEVETLGTEEQLARNEVFQEAASIRRTVLRERAEAEVAKELQQAEKLKQDGNWKAASACAARIRGLVKEHDIRLLLLQQDQLAAVEQHVEKLKAGAVVQQEFEKALSALNAIADKIDTRLLTSNTLTLDEAQKLEATFATFWKRMERFQLPVGEGELARLQGIGEAIRRQAALKRGAKKAINVTIASVCIGTLIVAAWAGYVSWWAYDCVARLNNAQSQGQVYQTKTLIETFSTAPWGASAVPAFGVAMEEKRQWVQHEMDQLKAIAQQLEELETSSSKGFAGLLPTELHSKMSTVEKGVGDLPADLAVTAASSTKSPKERLVELQNKADQHFTVLKVEVAKNAEIQVDKLSKLVRGLDYGKPVADLAKKLTSIDEVNKKLDEFRNSEVPELRLPADIDASAKKLMANAAEYSKGLAAFSKAKKEMSEAVNIEAYKHGLEGCSKLLFAEASAAARVLANFPSLDFFGSRRFYDGDLDLWKQAKKDAFSVCRFYPERVGPGEMKIIFSITNDPKLNEGDGKKLLEAMFVDSLTDLGREHYQKPLIGAMDALFSASERDSIVKAYLALKIYDVMKIRKNEWGLQYCRELTQDMSRIEQIPGAMTLRSGDWSLPSVRQKLSSKLGQFFEELAGKKPYAQQAQSRFQDISLLVREGISFVGYIDEEHKLKLNSIDPSCEKVWGITDSDGSPSPVHLVKGKASNEETRKLRQWSPVFALPKGLTD